MPGFNGPLQYGHACRSISIGISIMATLLRGDSEEFNLPEEVHGLPEVTSSREVALGAIGKRRPRDPARIPRRTGFLGPSTRAPRTTSGPSPPRPLAGSRPRGTRC